MASRSKFLSKDDVQMTNFVYQKLRAGEPSADNPCGLKLWRMFKKEKDSGRSVSSLTSRFRKYIKGNLATMPMEPFKILYVLKKLRIPIKDEHAQSSLRRRSNCVIVFSCDGKIISFGRRGDATEKQGSAVPQQSPGDRLAKTEEGDLSWDDLSASSIASITEIRNLAKPQTPSSMRKNAGEGDRRVSLFADVQSEDDQRVEGHWEDDSEEGVRVSEANEAFVQEEETRREEPIRSLDTHETVINSQVENRKEEGDEDDLTMMVSRLENTVLDDDDPKVDGTEGISDLTLCSMCQDMHKQTMCPATR